MPKAPPQEVRLIGGRFKRTPLPVPALPGLRPTPARVRETLFNWLGQDLTGWRVLDAFAGSGALGLESASRGAQSVTLLEQHPELVQELQRVLARLVGANAQVQRADALAWMRRFAQDQPGGGFDLVMLDPPFDRDIFDEALALAQACVVNQGYVYLEAPQPWGAAAAPGTRQLPPGLSLLKQGQAGAVHFHLLQCARAG